MGNREGNGGLRGRGDKGKSRKGRGRRKVRLKGERGGRGRGMRGNLRMDVRTVGERRRKKARARTAETAKGKRKDMEGRRGITTGMGK